MQFLKIILFHFFEIIFKDLNLEKIQGIFKTIILNDKI